MTLGRKSNGEGYVGVGKDWGSALIKAHRSNVCMYEIEKICPMYTF